MTVSSLVLGSFLGLCCETGEVGSGQVDHIQLWCTYGAVKRLDLFSGLSTAGLRQVRVNDGCNLTTMVLCGP